MKETVRDFFGADPRSSPDYGRIVNARHHRRLMKLIPGSGEVVAGGNADENERYIAPTILRNVSPDAPVMADEIFGPILPVLAVRDIEQAISFVNQRPKPLALYLFSNDPLVQQTVLERTSSGGATVNHTLLHLTVPVTPLWRRRSQRHGSLSRPCHVRDLQPQEVGAGKADLARPVNLLSAVQQLQEEVDSEDTLMTNLLAAAQGTLAKDALGDGDGDLVQVLRSAGSIREDR